MVIITINNSYSKISGLTADQEKALRKELSYVVGGSSSYFSKYGPKRTSLLSKRGEFPTGCLNRAITHLKRQCDLLTVEDSRIRPEPKFEFGFEGRKSYPWQDEALERAILYKRGIISATTGSGKSKVIQMIAYCYGLRTLVIVPSLGIKKQLSETLKNLPNVEIENIDSPRLKTMTDFDVLIIDEGHHVAARTYRKLNKLSWNTIYYRFFLTATPFRNDTEETLLFESIAGQIIYELTYKEAVKNKYIVPIEAYYLEMPKKETDAYTYPEVYSQLVVHNEDRNNQIAYLMLKLNQNKTPALCLVREVAHGKLLSDMTGIPFVNGADDESRDYIRQFNSGEIKALIGTTGVLGEGIDSKPAEYVVIAGLGKAKSQFMQQVGRVLRRFEGKESGKVILIRDNSHKYTLRHFKEQCKILKEEYGINKPLKLEIE